MPTIMRRLVSRLHQLCPPSFTPQPVITTYALVHMSITLHVHVSHFTKLELLALVIERVGQATLSHKAKRIARETVGLLGASVRRSHHHTQECAAESAKPCVLLAAVKSVSCFFLLNGRALYHQTGGLCPFNIQDEWFSTTPGRLQVSFQRAVASRCKIGVTTSAWTLRIQTA